MGRRLPPLAFHRLDDFARRKHFDVHRKAQAAVVHRPAVLGECVLKVAKQREQLVHKQVQQLQTLLPGHGPSEGSRVHTAHRLDSSFVELAHQGLHVARPQLGLRRHVALGQLLPVVGVVVPLPPFWLSGAVEQHGVALPHHPVKRLHQVLLLALEVGREVVALGQKMMGVARHHFNAPVCRARAQQIIQPPLVRKLVLEARGPGCRDHVVHHIEHGTQRVRLIDGHVVHAVSLLGPGR